MSLTREHLAQEIIDAGRFLYGRGWSPATSSNYSTRLSPSEALLTVSGKHKGQLGLDDVLATDLSGNSLEPGKKPSAETLLHTQLYSWRPEIGAVLHTHSVNATVLSRLTPQDFIEFEDYDYKSIIQRSSGVARTAVASGPPIKAAMSASHSAFSAPCTPDSPSSVAMSVSI